MDFRQSWFSWTSNLWAVSRHLCLRLLPLQGGILEMRGLLWPWCSELHGYVALVKRKSDASNTRIKVFCVCCGREEPFLSFRFWIRSVIFCFSLKRHLFFKRHLSGLFMEVTLSSTAAEACVLNRVVCCLEALSSTLVFLFVSLFLCGFLVAFIFFRGGGGELRSSFEHFCGIWQIKFKS